MSEYLILSATGRTDGPGGRVAWALLPYPLDPQYLARLHRLVDNADFRHQMDGTFVSCNYADYGGPRFVAPSLVGPLAGRDPRDYAVARFDEAGRVVLSEDELAAVQVIPEKIELVVGPALLHWRAAFGAYVVETGIIRAGDLPPMFG